jgi:dehydrogenase/reductase SDR family member 12
MIKTLASLFFYTRFFLPFSTVGLRKRWRANPAPRYDFSGQHWIVTGASGGIGEAITLGALRAGATVWALARDPQKLAELQRRAGVHGARLKCLQVDLSSLACIGAITSACSHVDVLVHNIGIMQHDYLTNDRGIERSFATNVLVPFALTQALCASKALKPSSVILSMSSGGALGAKLDVKQLEASSAAEHDGFMAYAQHKRAQIELTRAWNQQAIAHSYVMHPGWVDTAGVRSSLPMFRAVLKRFLRSAEQGADIALWLAATQPPIQAEPQFWLDRVPDAIHAFGFTKGGDSSEQLVSYLHERLARNR